MTKFHKITRAVALLTIIVTIMGCGIGYNKTLFLTKSNVGLDASVAPRPTFDLAMSRFEGVISPGFEKGKKLPVLASFRFENKEQFSPAVGSTYAAGDAAIALAALYGDKTDGANANARLAIVNSDTYDSSLKLDKEPKIRKGLLETLFPSVFLPQEYQTEYVEPVIFGTDTSLGLKIAWSTAPAPPAPFPDSLKFGYNRTEIGLAPVAMHKDDNNKVNMKMASLLATVDTGATIEAEDQEVNLEHLQYFATGKAATLLTLQQDVRKAMLARLDPHVKYYAGKFVETVKGRARTVFISTLLQIQTVLQKTNDPRAKQLAERMDSVESLVPETYEFTRYQWNPIPGAPPDQPQNELKATPPDPDTLIKKAKLATAVAYWNDLKDSINALESAGASTEPFIYLGHIASPQERAELAVPYEKIIKMFEEFDHRLLSHPDIVAALQYLSELLR